MEKPNIGKIVIREIVFIALSVTAALGINKLGIVIPGIGADFYIGKLAGMLYIGSIACRVGMIFIKMTLLVAFIIGLIAAALVFLSARYPATFAFLRPH